MAEVRFTNKPEPKVIPQDTSWYKKECHKCPYLIREPAFDTDGDLTTEPKIAVRCVRPTGDECLADAMLVKQLLLMEQYKAIAKKVQNTPAQPRKVSVLTSKRRNKIHKRKR